MAAAKQWKEQTCTKSITQKKYKLQPLPAPPVGYEDNSLGVNQQWGQPNARLECHSLEKEKHMLLFLK